MDFLRGLGNQVARLDNATGGWGRSVVGSVASAASAARAAITEQVSGTEQEQATALLSARVAKLQGVSGFDVASTVSNMRQSVGGNIYRWDAQTEQAVLVPAAGVPLPATAGDAASAVADPREPEAGANGARFKPITLIPASVGGAAADPSATPSPVPATAAAASDDLSASWTDIASTAPANSGHPKTIAVNGVPFVIDANGAHVVASRPAASASPTPSDDPSVPDGVDALADCDVVVDAQAGRVLREPITAGSFTRPKAAGHDPEETSPPPHSSPANSPRNGAAVAPLLPSMPSIDGRMVGDPRAQLRNRYGEPATTLMDETDDLLDETAVTTATGIPLAEDGTRVPMTTWENVYSKCYAINGWEGGKVIFKVIMWFLTVCTAGLLMGGIWGVTSCCDLYRRRVDVVNTDGTVAETRPTTAPTPIRTHAPAGPHVPINA